MLLFLEQFDDIRVERVAQPVSEVFTHITGRSCYFLAQLCALGSILIACFVATHFATTLGLIFGFPFVFVIPYFALLYYQARRLDKRSHSLSLQAMSPFRMFMPYGVSRTILLILVCIFFYHDYTKDMASAHADSWILYVADSAFLLVLIHMHFMACTPVKPTPFRFFMPVPQGT